MISGPIPDEFYNIPLVNFNCKDDSLYGTLGEKTGKYIILRNLLSMPTILRSQFLVIIQKLILHMIGSTVTILREPCQNLLVPWYTCVFFKICKL